MFKMRLSSKTFRSPSALIFVFIMSIATICRADESHGNVDEKIPENAILRVIRVPDTIEVPYNCRDRFSMDKNGQCRDVFDRDNTDLENEPTTKAPGRPITAAPSRIRPNCPEGFEMDVSGICREVFFEDYDRIDNNEEKDSRN